MARRRQHVPPRVYLNNRFVGRYLKETSGATSFRYDEAWLAWDNSYPSFAFVALARRCLSRRAGRSRV